MTTILIILFVLTMLIIVSKIFDWPDILTFVFTILLGVSAIVSISNLKQTQEKLQKLEMGCPQYEQVEEILWRKVE